MNDNPNGNVPFQRSQSADFAHPQPRTGLLMTHSSGALPTSSPTASFQRRTVESARQFRNSLSNVIREIEPLVETARSVQQNAATISTFFNNPRPTPEVTVTGNGENYVALNLEGTGDVNEPPENEANARNHEAAFLDNNRQNNNNAEGEVGDEMAKKVIMVILRYVPFVLILLAKAAYDYHESIFILMMLFATFAHSNNAVKQETLKRGRRSLWQLSIELVYITICMVFLHYVFADDANNFDAVLNWILIRTFSHPLTVWNLLWIVIITDFTLKLITVTVKILVTLLPGNVLPFNKRGKVYLFIEAVSQMYRSIATIQPWLYYLLESYEGPEKIVAVFLSAFYMISKGSDLMFKVKLLKSAVLKLVQSVAIGSSPSKEQIQSAGENCPICHDNFDVPVLLECRHIFCESCVTTWFDREQSCPLCRAKIVDDPSWRDGSTSYFIQLF